MCLWALTEHRLGLVVWVLDGKRVVTSVPVSFIILLYPENANVVGIHVSCLRVYVFAHYTGKFGFCSQTDENSHAHECPLWVWRKHNKRSAFGCRVGDDDYEVRLKAVN